MRIPTQIRSLAAATLICAALVGPATALAQVCEEPLIPPPEPVKPSTMLPTDTAAPQPV